MTSRPIPRPAPRAPAERDVLADIRLALGQEPDLVLWRLSQGAGVLVQPKALEMIRQRVVDGRVGSAVGELDSLITGARFARQGMIAGAADLIGILTIPVAVREADGSFRVRGVAAGDVLHVGRFFALEVKRPAAPGRSRGRTSEEQDQWLALVRRMGGFAAVVSSVDEARAALERARRGDAQ